VQERGKNDMNVALSKRCTPNLDENQRSLRSS
jgi:hypothetical protein